MAALHLHNAILSSMYGPSLNPYTRAFFLNTTSWAPSTIKRHWPARTACFASKTPFLSKIFTRTSPFTTTIASCGCFVDFRIFLCMCFLTTCPFFRFMRSIWSDQRGSVTPNEPSFSPLRSRRSAKSFPDPPFCRISVVIGMCHIVINHCVHNILEFHFWFPPYFFYL